MVELAGGTIRYVPGTVGARFVVSYPRQAPEPGSPDDSTATEDAAPTEDVTAGG